MTIIVRQREEENRKALLEALVEEEARRQEVEARWQEREATWPLTRTAAPEVVTMTGKFESSTDKPVTTSESSVPTPSTLLLRTPHLSAAPQPAHFHLPQPGPPKFEGGGSNFGVGFKQEKYPGPIHVTSIANDGLVACQARAGGQVHTHACGDACVTV